MEADRTLEALLERVKGLDGPDRETDGAIALFEGWTFKQMKGDRHSYWRKPGATEYYDRVTGGPPAYTASLDAVVALCERVLPGWMWSVDSDNRAYVRGPDAPSGAQEGVGHAATAPLALLAAILSALIQSRSPSLVGE